MDETAEKPGKSLEPAVAAPPAGSGPTAPQAGRAEMISGLRPARTLAVVGLGLLGAGVGGLATLAAGKPLLSLGTFSGGALLACALGLAVACLIAGSDREGHAVAIVVGLGCASLGLVCGLIGGPVRGAAWTAPAAAAIALLAQSNVPGLLWRELMSYFLSPMAYLVMFLFVALTGIVFWTQLTASGLISMRGTFSVVSFLLMFVAPLLTMRLVSEERSSGTLEMLLTAPVRDGEVAVAKYLAALSFFAVVLLPTLAFVGVLFAISDRGPDMGAVWAGYLGLALQGGLFLACGLFASTLTRSQVAAAILGFAFCLGFLMLGVLTHVDQIRDSPRALEVAQYISLPARLENFTKGLVDTRDLVYLLSLSGLFLFATAKGIELKKWR